MQYGVHNQRVEKIKDEGRPRIQDGLVVQLTTSDRFFSFEVKTARAER